MHNGVRFQWFPEAPHSDKENRALFRGMQTERSGTGEEKGKELSEEGGSDLFLKLKQFERKLCVRGEFKGKHGLYSLMCAHHRGLMQTQQKKKQTLLF